MIKYEDEYKIFIIENGVGKNDKIADSVKSYISYLNSVCKHLNIIIEPNNLRTQHDITKIALKLNGIVSNKTIKNYESAMKQYINMIGELKL